MEKNIHYDLLGVDEKELAQQKQYTRYNELKWIKRTPEQEKEFLELFEILSPNWKKG